MNINKWPFRPKLVNVPADADDRLVLIKNAKRQAFFRIHRSLSEPVSLIVPTYNVETFIDQFFWSIVTQTTGLENVEVIVVDDGSTDGTPAIAKLWASHFPDTIKYVYQENTGLCGARNKGLSLATGTWVSFPDPDDFVSRTFFAEMNKEIKQTHEKPVLFIAAKLVLFWEKTGEFNVKHPLRYRFKRGRRELQSSNLRDHIQLQVCSAWFKRSAIVDNNLTFDERIRPTFEDGHLVYQLLMREPNSSIIVLPSARYFYRKREAGNSLVDASRTKPAWFIEQLKYGPLDLVQSANRILGFVPVFLQRAVLYEIKWRFEHLMDKPELSAFLSQAEKDACWDLLTEIVSHIDVSTITNFSPPHMHVKHKIALSAMVDPNAEVTRKVTVFEYDTSNNLMQLMYISRLTPPVVNVEIDGQPCDRYYPSKIEHSVLEHEYFTERSEWFKVDPDQNCKITMDGQNVKLVRSPLKIGAYGQAQLDELLPPVKRRSLRKPVRLARKLFDSSAAKTKYHDCWVFMDRDDRADDNAEHLYRYLLNKGEVQNCYFVLKRDASDWARLEKEGFNLIESLSKEHIAAIMHAKFLISSHIDHFILWPTDQKVIIDLAHYKFVFLQHGVIKDDLSNWLNTKPISMMVTSTKGEYDSIAKPTSNYLMSENDVVLSGLPRHDSLLVQTMEKKFLLIMPTWRKYLTDETDRTAMDRKKISNFDQTEFYKHWSAVLKSPELKALADKRGLEIVFCPHPNLEMYLDDFALPDYIRKWSYQSSHSLQDLFGQTFVMITDYSSAVFDVAVLDQPIIYYQFDREQFFSGEHVYRKGYFDYETDGFGPVVTQHGEVLDALNLVFDDRENPEYSERRISTFAFRDGQNCKRTIEAIENLV